MKIKEFEAHTLKECLQQVRQELGPDAVILETKKLHKSGFMGVRAHDAVRIVAATGIAVNESRPREEKPAEDRLESVATATRPREHATAYRDVSAQTAMAESKTTPVSRMQPDAADALPNRQDFTTLHKLTRLEQEMEQLKQSMARHTAQPPASSVRERTDSALSSIPHPELLRKLLDAEVIEELALSLMEAIPDLSGWSIQARAPLAESALREQMANRLQTASPITLTNGKTKIVALVGPTGVGKTTTIAKLAAHYALVEKRRVGLLTVDTYRIAAVEQLKTYSHIMDIPVRVAYNQADIAPALDAFKDCDLVLIDTAGRSQKNVMQISELKSLVETTQCETHLVLSASTKPRDLTDQLKRFSTVGVHRLLFTKLDETTTYGTIYSLAVSSELPVSYLTTGQKVPEDIEIADSARLTALVLNASPLH